MRGIAMMGLALLAAGGADAQRVVRQGPGAGAAMPSSARTTNVSAGRTRWGASVDGRWSGGTNAPGGWQAYRRPTRGWALPVYWIAPRFYVTDWRAYGLGQPAAGYRWARYYDDAVLIDRNGSIYDSVADVDWSRGDDAYYATDDAVYAGPAERGGEMLDRPPPPPVYAGRDDGAGYEPPVAPPRAPPPPPHRAMRDPAPAWVSADGTTTVTTSGGGYDDDGYRYPHGSVTTVTVQGAPMVTTTTSEVYRDEVTYVRKPARRAARARTWRARSKVRCACGS